MMSIAPYRRLLGTPGVRSVLLIGLLGRIPVLTIGLTLTLHVVGTMKLGFFQAGLVGAAWTGGVAVGAPISGHFVDRYGLRRVVATTTAAQVVFWPVAAFLPYWPLVGGTLAAGIMALPIFPLIRQCLAAVVPPEQHRTAFALDSILVELSWIFAPPLAVGAISGIGSRWAMVVIAGGLVAAGSALLVSNPPTRAEEGPNTTEATVPLRRWLTTPVLTVLALVAVASFVGGAGELSLIAALKADGATQWLGLVITVVALASVIGGLAYGALNRSFSPFVLTAVMAIVIIPIGLVGSWQLLCVALIPYGMLGSPTMSATTDALSQRVPAAARGAALGLQNTFSTFGGAVVGPIAGYVIDKWGTGWSFAVIGILGLLMVVAAIPFWRRGPQPAEPVPVAPAQAAATPHLSPKNCPN